MTPTSSPESTSDVSSPEMQSVPVMLDSQDRVRASKEQRRVILAEFERSGVSAARFAKRTGLKYSTFAGWLQRYGRAKPKGPRSRPVRLLEAVLDQGVLPERTNGEVVVVQVSGQARVELSALAQLPLVVALVRALEKPC
jgi:transposase-like protein